MVTVTVAVPVLVAAVLGGGAGVATRRWLARLPRGAPVPAGWCEAGLALSGAATAGLVVSGLLDPRWTALLAVLSWLTVAGSATDLQVRRLPNALTLPALALVPAALVPAGVPRWGAAWPGRCCSAAPTWWCTWSRHGRWAAAT
ncbi:hypothetical protein [Pseudonocardia alni]|uniref:hypothetical protein n=1 Tax=Pseudonocardia alni TaxID=33907 RepID=UPI0038701FB7